MAALPPGPEQARLWMLKTQTGLVHRDWDEAASLRVAEIESLIILLRRGAELVPPALRATLRETSDQADNGKRDLRVSALESTLDRLRHALIELQIWLETSADPLAVALLGETWTFLVKANQRRYVDVMPW